MASVSFTLLDNQNVLATVSFADATGAAVALTSGVVPVWTVDNGSVLSINNALDPSGLTAVLTALGPQGVANVTVTTTIGSNAPIIATAAITVSAGGPVSATISFGTPASN